MKICSNHPEYPVPLIWTFSFPGSEYWCPYCGINGGMLGTGERAEETPELIERREKHKEASKDYLYAMGVPHSSSMVFEGKRTTFQELPREEKDRIDNLQKEYKYQQKL